MYSYFSFFESRHCAAGGQIFPALQIGRHNPVAAVLGNENFRGNLNGVDRVPVPERLKSVSPAFSMQFSLL